jgi:hypothetical protein
MKGLRSCVAAALVAAAPSLAGAATLDFSGVQGLQASPLVLSNATLTNLTAAQIIVGPGAAGEADGFCFIAAGSCEADGEILFSSAVTNLTFDIDGADFGDNVEISAFNGATLVGSQVFTTNAMVDFSAFGAITRLLFDDSSTAAGFGYSTFSFNQGEVVVPAPAAMSLFLFGLAGLGVALRRP